MSVQEATDSYALDELEPLEVQVGYGELGRQGALGYENGRVTVQGRTYSSALSTHPPARLRYAVPPGCLRLRCQVALNDDVSGGGLHAGFTVLADGRVVAEAPYVRAGQPPVPLVAEVDGAATVELVASTTSWANCHAVWLEPVLDRLDDQGSLSGSALVTTPTVLTDPLQRADIAVPTGIRPAQQCIATVGSAGFEQWVDDLLGSVRAFGGCPDALLVVFALGEAPALDEVAARHGATVVRCRPRRNLDPTSKSVLYSVASVLPAQRFVCLDADMLVLSALSPLFAAIDACAPGSLLVCGEGNDHGIPDLAAAVDMAYGGGTDPPFFARRGLLGSYPLVANDGLLAGSRGAFLAFEAEVRGLPDVLSWVDARPDIRWRNQFAANVALAQRACAVELDPTWNVQLHVQGVEVDGNSVRWRGRDVRVLHFSGVGKNLLADLRQRIRQDVQLAELAEMGQLAGAVEPGSAALLAQPWRSVQVPEQVLAVPTMLSHRELQLLHWLARDYVTAAGRIVDGGCFLGGPTAALASGLAARADGPWVDTIASYDLFRVEEYTLDKFAGSLPDPTIGASFRSAFDANTACWAQHVEVREGDAGAIGWSGEPIEVLFLDMVKTWPLNDLVLREFLPHLIPGRSIIVQQDYLWGYGYWVHLTMELLDGCVQQLDAMANGSVVYLLTAPVPADLIGARLRESLPPNRQRELMDRAVDRWQGEERGLVELARVSMIADLDGHRPARAELTAVLARHTGSARVRECAGVVARYLK